MRLVGAWLPSPQHPTGTGTGFASGTADSHAAESPLSPQPPPPLCYPPLTLPSRSKAAAYHARRPPKPASRRRGGGSDDDERWFAAAARSDRSIERLQRAHLRVAQPPPPPPPQPLHQRRARSAHAGSVPAAAAAARRRAATASRQHRRMLAALTAAAHSCDDARTAATVRAVAARETAEIDVSGYDVSESDVAILATVAEAGAVSGVHRLRVGPHVVCPGVGRALVRLVQALPGIIAVDGVEDALFQEGAQLGELCAAVRVNRVREDAGSAEAATLALCAEARRLDLRVRQRFVEEAVMAELRGRLWTACARRRCVVEEQALRWYVGVAHHAGLLRAGERAAAAVAAIAAAQVRLEEGARLAAALVAAEEAARREQEAAREACVAEAAEEEVAARVGAAERDRARRKVHRREGYEVKQAQLQARHAVMRREAEEWRAAAAAAEEGRCGIATREAAARAEAEAARVAEAEERRTALETRQAAEREVQAMHRAQVQEREQVLRQERVGSSELAISEDRGRADVARLWEREVRVARVDEARGNRYREKLVAEALPPTLALTGRTSSTGPSTMKYFCTGQRLQKQLLPRARLEVLQQALTYHTGGGGGGGGGAATGAYDGEHDPELPHQWFERKTTIHGGTVTAWLDREGGTFRDGDQLDLVDSITLSDMGVDLTHVEHKGVPVATVASLEHYSGPGGQENDVPPGETAFTPAQLGVRVWRVVFELCPDATVEGVSMLLRMIGFQSPGSPGSLPTGAQAPHSLCVHIELELLFEVRTDAEEIREHMCPPPPQAFALCDRPRELASASVAAVVVVTVVPSAFRVKPGASAVAYKEGDGVCHFAHALQVSRGGSAHEPWEGHTLTMQHAGVMCPKDAVALARRPRRIFGEEDPPASDDFTVLEKKRSVWMGNRHVAQVEREGSGLLLGAESTSGLVSTTAAPRVVLSLLAYMTGHRLTKLAQSFVFYNEAVDPLDGLRVVQLTLTDPQGDTDLVRFGIDVTSEDTKTTFLLNTEACNFRRVVGDIQEGIRPFVPKQPVCLFAPEASVTDIDTESFTTGHLIVILSKATLQDQIAIDDPKGEVTTEGVQVLYRRVMLGVFEVTRTRHTVAFHLTFGKNASIAAAQAVVRSLGFHTEAQPPATHQDELAALLSSGVRAWPLKNPEVSDICVSSVKAGVRDVEFSLSVENAEPVVAKTVLRVWNALLTVPPALQSLSFVERSPPIKVLTKFELLPDVLSYDNGSMVVEIVFGEEPRDALEMTIPDGSELVLTARRALTYDRDIIHQQSRSVVGSYYGEDAKIVINFQHEPRDAGRKMIRRKDISNLLRLISYEHRGDNPRQLNKILRVSLDDGLGHPSYGFVHVCVQPVNDVTQITRTTPRPAVYRQASKEDEDGYCPFEEASLYDADTEDFAGGYLAVDIVLGQRGMDRLCILPPHLQELKGYAQTAELHVVHERRDHALSYGGVPIGTVSYLPTGLVVNFYRGSKHTTLEVVEHIMRIVQYTNVSKKIRPGTMLLAVRVAPQEDGADGLLEGKMRLPVQIAEPLLSVEEPRPEVLWKGEPVVVAPQMHLSLPDRHKCIGVFVTCRLLNSAPGDLLSFKFEGSKHNLMMKGSRGIVSNSLMVARVSERRRDAFRVDMAKSGVCTANLVKEIMRCVSFHCTQKQYTRALRRVEMVLHLQDALPGMLVLDVSVAEPDTAAQLHVRHRDLTVRTHASMHLFADATLQDRSTGTFAAGTFFRVCVADADGTDALELRLPPERALEKALRSRLPACAAPPLVLTAHGWVKDSGCRVARVHGNKTGALSVDFTCATLEQVQLIMRHVTYTSTAVIALKARQLDASVGRYDPLHKRLRAQLQGKFPVPTEVEQSVEVCPPVLTAPQKELEADGQGCCRLLPGSSLDGLANYTSAVLSARFVSAAAAPDDPVRHPFFDLGFDTSAEHGVAVSSQGVVTLPASNNPCAVSAAVPHQSLTVEFPSSDVGFIERVVHALVVRPADKHYRHGKRDLFVRVDFSTRAFAVGSSGPQESTYVVTVLPAARTKGGGASSKPPR